MIITMKQLLIIAFVLFLVGILPTEIHAQEIQFKRLNTSNGLSDNLVYDACLDKNGLVWVATGLGLDSYNGNRVTHWHQETDRFFESRDIRSVYADPKNRIWVLDAEGKVICLGKNRKADPITIKNGDGKEKIRFLMPDEKGIMYLLIGNGIYKEGSASMVFEKTAELPDSLIKGPFLQHYLVRGAEYLLTGSNKIIHLNLSTGSIVRHWTLSSVIAAVLLENGDLLASTEKNRELFLMDYTTGAVKKNEALLPDTFGKPVQGYLRYMYKQPDGRVFISSGYGGLYIYSPGKKRMENYRHDPLDQRTISGNNTYKITGNRDGFVFITTRSSGLNYFNAKWQMANTRKIFQESGGDKIFDGFIGPVERDGYGKVWLGAQGGLMEWDQKDNKVIFHNYGEKNGEPIAGKEEVRALWFDRTGKLWLGMNRYGVVVLDKNKKPLEYFFSQQTDSSKLLPGDFVLDIKEGPDQNIWVATVRGLAIFNQETLRRIPVIPGSPLWPYTKKRVSRFWVEAPGVIWFATNNEIVKYSIENAKTTIFSKQEGLKVSPVFSIAGDGKGNVFVGSSKGIQMLDKSGRFRSINGSERLPSQVCVGLIADREGNVWMSGDNFLSCLNDSVGLRGIFDESYGFSGNGFRYNAAFLSDDNKLYYGCNEGVSWFSPSAILKQDPGVSAYISQVETNKGSVFFTGNGEINIESSSNNLIAYVTPVSLTGFDAIVFQYQLLGKDKEWQNFKANNGIRINELKPGEYVLKVRFSYDGNRWIASTNKLDIRVIPAWWQKGWVRLMAFLLLSGLLGGAITNYTNKRKKEQEEQETEKAILYLTTAIHGNTNQDEMLWDVVENVISRLGFEDCVIYLLQKPGNILIQKAAWGPKTDKGNKISNPIEIPLGKGIVGSVAQTGISEIVNDTSQDSRYITDDEVRLSEIAVPIMDEGVVLGVIDSEHSRKHFFTQRHLSILSTISSLLGSKLTRAQAEEEKRKAELALVDIKRKAAEVEMQALRAQMNPHFMFNSLNSINNFILNSDIENASSYLTRFSRLMRLILDNSRHDWVPLEQELHALELYIGMESLRFDNAFTWQITVGEGIEAESAQIPPLLIQPYVENAIWHGLMHRKATGGHLQVTLIKSDDILMIEIEDNGVGREAAAKLKHQMSGHKKSHGMDITSERIAMINRVYGAEISLEIIDKRNENHLPDGTLVQLIMQYRLQHQTRV